MNPLFHTEFSISDSLKNVRKSVLIYETIIVFFQDTELKKYIIYTKALFGIMNKLGLYILMVKNIYLLVTNKLLMNFVKQKYQICYIKYAQ